MTAELLAFLRARLNDTARKAQAAIRDGAARWHAELNREYDGYAVADEHGEPVAYNEGAPSIAQATHIAEHDPARVLAEVDAKRRIIDEHADDFGDCRVCADPATSSDDVDGNRDWSRTAKPSPCQTLRLLALPYAGHPDYRPEWVPDS
ncbi:hypothetical protein KCMC57_63730 (plasmid) [Kitasatospora sp. CMC57]|uniref:DksA C4-type domain-containing protein n=1 Tax=Kitasatospora sp. CMC57 TaxID=3231513 RepID=A0AB33KEW8_9ACTN